VVGEGERLWRGRRVKTFKLTISYEGSQTQAEVTEDGEVLEQTINYPLKLKLVREGVPRVMGRNRQ
jgi:hypothetical protein